MPKADWKYMYIVSLPQNSIGWVGLLDMLRYDDARVWDVSHERVIIITERPATVARWASFGFRLDEKR